MGTKLNKAKREAAINRMRRLIAGNTHVPAIDFQRFNVAGLDLKGQRVSGFGEIGLGLSFGASVNIGNLICPGVVRTGANATVSGEGAARSLLLIQRDAKYVRQTRVTPGFDTSDWLNAEPVSLHLLDGGSFEGQITAGAQAAIGIGDFLQKDENGIGIGAKVEVGATYQYVKLGCDHPQYFVSPYATALEDEFNAIVNHKIKRSIALFIVAWNRTGLGKSVREFVENIPDGPVDDRLAQLLKAAHVSGIKERLDEWDLSWSTNFSAIVKGFWNAWDTFNLKSSTLMRDLRRARNDVDDYLVKNKKNVRTYYDEYYHGKLSAEEAVKRLSLINQYERMQSIRDSLETAETVLENRVQGKDAKNKPRSALDTKKPPKNLRPSLLHAHITRFDAMAGAGAKATFEFSGVAGASVAASAVSEGLAEITTFGWDAASRGFKDSLPTVVVCREQTVVTKQFLELKAEALASVHGLGNEKQREADAKRLYGSMTYLSVRISRYETEDLCLPNGSGLSMGLSVLAKRLKVYAKQCEVMAKSGFENIAVSRVEKLLIERLCVDRDILRGFFADAILDWVDDDVAVLVEANFEFNEERQSFTKTERRNLLETRVALERWTQKSPDKKNDDNGNGSTRLQVLRLRLRQAESEKKRRLVFGLGYAEDLFSDAARSGRREFGGNIFRTYAAGVENTIDFHIRYYGPNADLLESTYQKNGAQMGFASEYSVAPVALFNF